MTVKGNDRPLRARTGWGGTVAARAWFSGLIFPSSAYGYCPNAAGLTPLTEPVPAGQKSPFASLRQFPTRDLSKANIVAYFLPREDHFLLPPALSPIGERRKDGTDLRFCVEKFKAQGSKFKVFNLGRADIKPIPLNSQYFHESDRKASGQFCQVLVPGHI